MCCSVIRRFSSACTSVAGCFVCYFMIHRLLCTCTSIVSCSGCHSFWFLQLIPPSPCWPPSCLLVKSYGQHMPPCFGVICKMLQNNSLVTTSPAIALIPFYLEGFTLCLFCFQHDNFSLSAIMSSLLSLLPYTQVVLLQILPI
jgi:hypothetical protein